MDITGSVSNSAIPSRNKPLLFILSGPSGVGKDAVLDRLKETSIPLTYIVTMTTRPPRDKEVNHKDYTFVSEVEFRDLIDQDGLLEWAKVYENMYGVPQKDVEDALRLGNDVMVKVDIQGVANIKKKKPEAISIFLIPPSIEVLHQRLKLRKTESASSLEIRMKTASEEMKTIKGFDYAVTNADNQIEQAVSDIKAVIIAEKLRIRK